jgi:hypothetical protein
MGLFDSICHAFTTTSTGGFSTKQTSIEYYHSPYIDYVISVFMFLSGVNFTLLLLMFNGKIKKFIHDAELKFYFMSVAFFTVFIAVWLYQTSSMGAEEAEISVPSNLLTDFNRFCHCRLYALAFHSLGLSSYRNDNGCLRRQYDRWYQMYPHGYPLQSCQK